MCDTCIIVFGVDWEHLLNESLATTNGVNPHEVNEIACFAKVLSNYDSILSSAKAHDDTIRTFS